jgi:hypothetical protein
MQEWAVYLGEWLAANNAPGNDGGLAQVYYDGEYGLYQVADNAGDLGTYEPYIDLAFKAYVDYYVLPSNGTVQGFRNFTAGQLEDVLRGTTRAADALQSIQLQLANGAYVATGDCADPALSRECAYAINTHINAQRAGITLSGAQLARLAQLKAWSDGHLDAWINNTAPYFRPFMGAITMMAEINYYNNIAADPNLITRGSDLADYAWSSCWKSTTGPWGAANAFLYTDRTGFDPSDDQTQPDLNMMIGPWFAWLYFVGAGAGYRTQFDDIFQGGVPVYDGPFYQSGAYLGTRSSINPSGKQYFQQLVYMPQGIAWAEAGAGAGTSYVSNASGNWTDSTKWTPNGVPGTGDDVTIATGHTITVTGAQEIGTSPAIGNVELTIETGASLVIGTNASLRVRCDVEVQGNGTIVSNAGSTFTFDSTLAASPSTTNYVVTLGDTNGGGANWDINGTSSARVTITSNILGAPGYIDDGGFTAAGLINAEYADFVRLGTAAIEAIKTSATGTSVFRLNNCTVNTCGKISRTYNIGADATYEISSTRFLNGIDAGGEAIVLSTGAPLGAGTRLISRSVLSGQLSMLPGEDFTVEDTVILGPVSTSAGDWDTFEGNFIRFTSSNPGPMNSAGDMTDCYFYYDNPTEWNPHFVQPLGGGVDQAFDGLIFDMNCNVNSPAQEGDCYTFATPGSGPCTATITRNIAVIGPSNKTVGTMFTMLGNANTYVIAEHNTCYAGGQGAAIGETYAGHTGMVTSFKSNLVFSVTPNNGYKLYVGSLTAIPDLVAAADCDYNAGWNLGVGNNGNNYNNLLFSIGTPGVNDLVGVNPQFVDAYRNLRTWSLYRGGNGTDTDAYARLEADPSLIADLIAYVREGFTPQNSAYFTAAHDGTTIGAVEGLVVPASMYVQPATLVANTTGNVVQVTGESTNWTPGTPGSPTFTISGVSGAAITSQVVNTPTSATLTVTASTGGAVGVAEISDGTIVAPVITVTPPTPPPGTPGQNARRRAW